MPLQKYPQKDAKLLALKMKKKGGQVPKGGKQPLKVAKVKERNSPPQPPNRNATLLTPWFSPMRPCQIEL